MSEAKQWTPGPWHAHDRGIGWEVHNVDGRINDEYRECFREADARLIAAAPALYDVLESLANGASGFLAFADPATHGNTNIAVLRERIEQAHAALRLATEGAPK